MRTTVAKFLSIHPVCAFCGGEQAATTIDHIPSAQTFYGKQRPEGLETPACKRCNDATRLDEQVFALACRFGSPIQAADEVHHAEFKSILTAVKNNRPKVLLEFKATARQRRKFAKSIGVSYSTLSDPVQQLPVINFNGPEFQRSFNRVAYKVGCALYYLNFNRPLPRQGTVAIKGIPNVFFTKKNIPPEFIELLGATTTLRQGRKHAVGQFECRVGRANDGFAMAFLARFFNSFVILGFVDGDEGTQRLTPESKSGWVNMRPPYL